MRIKYFIGGLFAALFALPVLQSLADLICSKVEVYKSDMSVKITKNNCEITRISMEAEPVSTNAVGFSIPSNYDDCDYIEDKRTIGFTGGAHGK